MDVQRLISTSRSERELREAIRLLATTIREAAECLLDLEQALESVRVAQRPDLAGALRDEARTCIGQAMRR